MIKYASTSMYWAYNFHVYQIGSGLYDQSVQNADKHVYHKNIQ